MQAVTARRAVRDTVACALLFLVLLALVDRVLWTPDRVVVVWVTGGVAAGLLLLQPLRRWWVVLAPLALVSVIGATLLGAPPVLAALAGLGEVASAAAYAAVVRRSPGSGSGLGSDLFAASRGFAVAGIVRVGYQWLLALAFGGAMHERIAQYWFPLGLSTIAGVLVGVPLVLAVSSRRTMRDFVDDRGFAILVTGLVVLLSGLVFLTHSLPTVSGEEYLVVPVLLWAAVRSSASLSAVLTSFTALVASASFAQGWGIYDGMSDSWDELIHLQAFLILVVLSRALVTDALERRRTAERRSAAAADDLARIVDLAPVPAVVVTVAGDGHLRVVTANRAFRSALRDPEAGASLAAALTTRGPLTLDDLADGDLDCRDATGSRLWLRPVVSMLDSHPGELPTAVVALEDVTASKAFEELARFHVHRDPMTGLPNRAELLERLERRVDEGRASVGLLLLDLNGLSAVNDALGHTAGDEVLAVVARRLRSACTSEDVLVRFSGDEFALLRDDVPDAESLLRWGRELLDAVRRPVLLGGRELVVTASAGCAWSEDAEARERDVLRAADSALREAKHAGRNQIAHHEVAPVERSASRLDLEMELHRALDEDRLVVLFQPVVEVGTGRVVGVEALSRLRDRAGLLLEPAVFLPLVEELGLMPRLTEVVLGQALDAAAAWRASGHVLSVAVNVQPRWLDPTTAATVRRELAVRGLPGDCLIVEITEDQTVDVTGSSLAVLRELVASGIRIAIDDFGTGYAGLSSFRSLPASIVKIDRVFVAAMLGRTEDHDLVHSMVSLAHRFGKRVVAEGVETQEQYEALRLLECDLVQGWLTGRPMPFDDVPLPLPVPTRALHPVPSPHRSRRQAGSASA